MDTKHLKTFITMAQTLNYQETSKILSYAPSTLSKHIESLEKE